MQPIPAMDTFMQQTLRAFLDNQREAYLATMPADDKNIAFVQAKYECACLALAVITRFVADINDLDTPTPEPLNTAAEAMHNAICQYGDDYLRRLGYKPEEF